MRTMLRTTRRINVMVCRIQGLRWCRPIASRLTRQWLTEERSLIAYMQKFKNSIVLSIMYRLEISADDRLTWTHNRRLTSKVLHVLHAGNIILHRQCSTWDCHRHMMAHLLLPTQSTIRMSTLPRDRMLPILGVGYGTSRRNVPCELVQLTQRGRLLLHGRSIRSHRHTVCHTWNTHPC